MKRLYLLRHAQALSANGGQDIERKLSPKGVDDAKALGRAMAKAKHAPTIAFCSTAARTQMTLDGVMKALHDLDITYDPTLYDGSMGDYLSLLQSVDEGTDSVLLVGHNPSVHMLAAHLAQEDGSATLGRLTSGYAPGSLSVFDVESWNGLKPYENKLIDLIDPVDYNAPDRPTRWM